MKIHDLISQAVEHRVGYRTFPKVFAEMRKNHVDDIVRDRLITVLIAWIEDHEKDCSLTKQVDSAKVNKESPVLPAQPKTQPANDSTHMDNASSTSSTGSSE